MGVVAPSLPHTHCTNQMEVRMKKPTARFYKPQEVADLLGVHRQTVYAHLRKGEFPAIQFGGQWLIPIDQFDDYLESQKRRFAAA